MGHKETELVRAIFASPLGPLHLAASDDGLVEMLFAIQEPPAAGARPAAPGHPVLSQAARELDAYFAGALTAFTVPLAPRGTLFQCAVWRALVAIPFGQRRAYRDIARALDKIGAERAVGAANGKNRIGIIVPCHRVVGADGTLTGYAGGLDKKQWLLDHEARVADSRSPTVLRPAQRDLFGR
jgi:methylated-DNA-[protein]-cysteine S-methyltransferase